MSILDNLLGWGFVGFIAYAVLNPDPGAKILPPANTPPAVSQSHGPMRVLTTTADAQGQFWISGSVNGGQPVAFMVDTGAGGIAFSKAKAAALGVDVTTLDFSRGKAWTANGTVNVATTRLARLAIGPFVLSDVAVWIIDGEMSSPLLGMTFLRRMNMSISNGKLTLRGPGVVSLLLLGNR